MRDIESTLNDVGGPGTSAAGSSGVRSRDPLLPNIPNIPAIPSFDPFGALGGAGFDIGSALGFISAISGIFACDLSILCSPNEYHTLQNGGNAKPGTDQPSNVSVARSAQRTAESQEPTATSSARYDTP